MDATCAFDFDQFDAVLVTYSVRLCYESYISPHLVQKLQEFKGIKALSIQDEYENTEVARVWMERIGFHLVFTCVPLADVGNVYPKSRFPETRFVNVLTGYVPEALVDFRRRPMSERKKWIAYRGRPLHPVYGTLGYEKLIIGERMKQECEKRQIPHDIEWREGARIYGDQWYDFLASARATLGTESGSNVFDEDNSLRASIDLFMKENPEATFPEVSRTLLADIECKHARMNQVSPKIFEAICLGTALVLFEGEYSGVVKPGRHYIPLKKDFSNIEEVLAKIADLRALEEMTKNAYEDVVASGKYSYRAFVGLIDDEIQKASGKPRGALVPIAFVGLFRGRAEPFSRDHFHNLPTSRPLRPEEWEYLKSYQPPETIVKLQKVMVVMRDEGIISFRTKKKFLELLRRAYRVLPLSMRKRWRRGVLSIVSRNWKYFDDSTPLR